MAHKVLPLMPRSFGWIALGMALGLAALLEARVEFYDWAGLQPNMAPQIAYFFGPIIYALLLLVAFVGELALQKIFGRPRSRTEALLVGVTYVTLLLWWAFPGYDWVMLCLNPLLLRWLITLVFRASVQPPKIDA
ncbi:MAG: hypothetical protein LBE81_01535 [Azonexus sp.]|uniref:hypothetical protein n=1 Tax=Azonexus sp. TaxID=1872668 RepID=UPI0028309EC2|nr:hypothetical protein [Azonexus sp.]MDR0775309.1 hypothetical protein [Azonexus sp.]